MKPSVFAFSGFSGSGKTTLIEKLIPLFKEQNLKISVIKHDAHQFDMDREGKDTYRFSKAGADKVMISSYTRSARISESPQTLEAMIEECSSSDVIIVEGYKYAKLTKIGIATSRTDYHLPCDISEYVAVVTDDKDALQKNAGAIGSCPVFDLNNAKEVFLFMLDMMNKKTDEGLTSAEEPSENRNDLTHFDNEGNARMVDVSAKDVTVRKATAAAKVKVSRNTFSLIKSGGIKKGDVLTVAQIAGIMGSKRTPDLIPMCHPIITDSTSVRCKLNEEDLSVDIESTVICTGRTGVEMEAICACSVAAMTVYDMCKAVQRDIEITDIRLISKSGGIHGDYVRSSAKPSLDAWIAEAKASEDASHIGMFLFHNGVVRADSRARVRENDTESLPVTEMEFSADLSKADLAIKETLLLPGIYYVKVWLNEGRLKVGDDIMLVLVGGDIRPHVIDALQVLVGKLKTECVSEKEING